MSQINGSIINSPKEEEINSTIVIIRFFNNTAIVGATATAGSAARTETLAIAGIPATKIMSKISGSQQQQGANNSRGANKSRDVEISRDSRIARRDSRFKTTAVKIAGLAAV